jgi:hypothetical protein
MLYTTFDYISKLSGRSKDVGILFARRSHTTNLSYGHRLTNVIDAKRKRITSKLIVK